MAESYSAEFEAMLQKRLVEHHAARQVAESRLMVAKRDIEEAKKAISYIDYVIDDYRKAHGLPPNGVKASPVLAEELAHMGPAELVEHWANKNDGEVVVKELAKAAAEAGAFPSRRTASTAIYGVVRRKPFDKIAPGHFKRKADNHNIQRTPEIDLLSFLTTPKDTESSAASHTVADYMADLFSVLLKNREHETKEATIHQLEAERIRSDISSGRAALAAPGDDGIPNVVEDGLLPWERD